GIADAGGEDQADDALTVPGPGGQQLQHPVVVGAVPGQRVADLVREVEVTDTDGIRVAQGADARRGRGPGPPAGQAGEHAVAALAVGGGEGRALDARRALR